MKTALKTLALYCQGVNGKVVSILDDLSDDELGMDLHTYYKSIFETYSHMTLADLNWLTRFKDLYPGSILSKSPFLQTTIPDLHDRMAENGRQLFIARKVIDLLYIDFIAGLDKDDLDKVIRYKNKAGDNKANKLGHILLHLFNHQTHHRGAISAMLDTLGIDNDYSGFFKYLPNEPE